jgi:hypothetical protein
MNILLVPRNVLPGALLVVPVRSDVNAVLPPVNCALGDGGIATFVTTFSVPSVTVNKQIIHKQTMFKARKDQVLKSSHHAYHVYLRDNRQQMLYMVCSSGFWCCVRLISRRQHLHLPISLHDTETQKEHYHHPHHHENLKSHNVQHNTHMIKEDCCNSNNLCVSKISTTYILSAAND